MFLILTILKYYISTHYLIKITIIKHCTIYNTDTLHDICKYPQCHNIL